MSTKYKSLSDFRVNVSHALKVKTNVAVHWKSSKGL